MIENFAKKDRDAKNDRNILHAMIKEKDIQISDLK
jgi:hypothetical protein